MKDKNPNSGASGMISGARFAMPNMSSAAPNSTDINISFPTLISTSATKDIVEHIEREINRSIGFPPKMGGLAKVNK